MIFATCGSSHLPFDRMMQALSGLPADELHVQHGPSAPPACAAAYPYLPFGEMVGLIGQARVVVTHAGVGSIICALSAGHVPVVFPRLKRYGEVPDDHQSELAEALSQQGSLLVAWTIEELPEVVAAVPARAELRSLHAERLSAAVRAAIWDEPIEVHALAAARARLTVDPRTRTEVTDEAAIHEVVAGSRGSQPPWLSPS